MSLLVFGAPESRKIPWVVIQCSEDEIVHVKEVENWVAAQPNPPEFHLMQDASNFFHGRLNDLRNLIITGVSQ